MCLCDLLLCIEFILFEYVCMAKCISYCHYGQGNAGVGGCLLLDCMMLEKETQAVYRDQHSRSFITL